MKTEIAKELRITGSHIVTKNQTLVRGTLSHHYYIFKQSLPKSVQQHSRIDLPKVDTEKLKQFAILCVKVIEANAGYVVDLSLRLIQGIGQLDARKFNSGFQAVLLDHVSDRALACTRVTAQRKAGDVEPGGQFHSLVVSHSAPLAPN
jgi:hypothetical protein